tara:strand:+ start:206 stop:610 length:405 start_codon:yes stop_codon:yes gene_type:complete
MRVSLQFTVDFDELPDRIVGFVRDACSRHDQIDALELLTSVEGCIKDDNTMAAINTISEFRSRLARIDFQLEDCVNIIRDYHMALVGEVKPVHQEPEPVSPSPVDAMSGLLSELHALQEMTNDIRSDDEQSEHG